MELQPVSGAEVPTPSTSGKPLTGRQVWDQNGKDTYVGAVRQWLGSVIDVFSILMPFAVMDLLPFPFSIIGVPLAAVGPLLLPGMMFHSYGFNPGMWITGGRLVRILPDGRAARVGVIRGSARYFLELLTLAVIVSVGITVPFSTIILLWAYRRVHVADRILGTRVFRRSLVPNSVAADFVQAKQPVTVPA